MILFSPPRLKKITMASLASCPLARAPVRSCAPRAAIAASASALPSSRQQRSASTTTLAVVGQSSRRRSVSSLLSSPSRRVVSASRGNVVVARAEISYIMVKMRERMGELEGKRASRKEKMRKRLVGGEENKNRKKKKKKKTTPRVRADAASCSFPLSPPLPADSQKFPHPPSKKKQTLQIKPDGVQRGLVGEIIGRFERKGFKLTALKFFVPPRSLAEEHYKDLSSKPFFGDLVSYICSGPVVAMVWEGEGVVASARKLIGATNPLAAEPGTIRGDHAIVTGRNVIHGSDSPENGERETALWFGGQADARVSWTRAVEPWLVE